MPAESLRAAPKPDPSHVRIEPTPPDTAVRTGWSIELSTDATVVELALLMSRFRCQAEVVSEDVMRLTPRDPWAPCPTGEQVIALFEQGLEGFDPKGPVRIKFAPEMAPAIPVEITTVCNCGAPGGYPHEPDCMWWESRK